MGKIVDFLTEALNCILHETYDPKELNLSPNYLSDLLKKETGKTAQEHMHLFVIEKA